MLRLNTQVEKVLQLAKIERDNIELNVEEINLAELITSISPSIELKVNDKKGILHLDLDAVNPLVKADRLHLTNILHNLVDNAVKCIKTSLTSISGCAMKAETCCLSVQDDDYRYPERAPEARVR